jgi:hypothetical protein
MSRALGAAAAPLLPGETAQSDVLEDADHWAAVYQELTVFLDRTHLGRRRTTESFHRRLDYWRLRQDELTTWRGTR